MSPSEIRKTIIPASLSFIGSLICIFFAFKLSANESNAKDFQAKIDKKADIEWVEKRLDEQGENQAVQNAWIIKTLDRIDKRTERLEDQQMNR